MKVLLIASLFLIAAAEAAEVKITSFTYPRQGQVYAELCGKVEGAETSPTFVKVTVDKGAKQATYNTVAGKDGKFCLTVVTYRGTAEAEILE